MDNTLDLAKIYGIPLTPVPPNKVGHRIPSLEEIAATRVPGGTLTPTQRSNTPALTPPDTRAPAPAQGSAQQNSAQGSQSITVPMPGGMMTNPDSAVPPSSSLMPVPNNMPMLVSPTNPPGLTLPVPLNPLNPITTSDVNPPLPATAQNIQYLNGFLRTQIGRRIEAEFLFGSNYPARRNGFLLGVGNNYIIINEIDNDDLLLCDFYNLKFIRIYY